jgi:hypothetical protein
MSPACVADMISLPSRAPSPNASRCRFARCRRTPPARDLATPRLEPGRGLAALHGGLIGGRGIARSRVLIDRERHFLLSVGADEDDRSRCDRVPDARFVPPRVRLGGDIREVLGHHTYGHDISREQRGRGTGDLGDEPSLQAEFRTLMLGPAKRAVEGIDRSCLVPPSARWRASIICPDLISVLCC